MMSEYGVHVAFFLGRVIEVCDDVGQTLSCGTRVTGIVDQAESINPILTLASTGSPLDAIMESNGL